jgi:hypothetical protein
MTQTVSMQAEVAALNVDFKQYLTGLRTDWLAQNRLDSRDGYEVLRPEEQAAVKRLIRQWNGYITPLVEIWWENHGYGVIWLDDDSQPIKVYKM